MNGRSCLRAVGRVWDGDEALMKTWTGCGKLPGVPWMRPHQPMVSFLEIFRLGWELVRMDCAAS